MATKPRLTLASMWAVEDIGVGGFARTYCDYSNHHLLTMRWNTGAGASGRVQVRLDIPFFPFLSGEGLLTRCGWYRKASPEQDCLCEYSKADHVCVSLFCEACWVRTNRLACLGPCHEGEL